MDNQNASTVELSAEENAYFESGGETEITSAPAPEVVEPEQGAQPEPEQQQDRDEKGRFVPHQALHAEREEHKKTRGELQSLKEQQAVLNDRWNTLLKLREGQEKQEETQAPPDPEADIFGYTKWQADQLKALTAKIEDREKQDTQRQQIETQEREIWNAWSTDANAYAAEKPEFGDALAFLSNVRSTQLKALGAIDQNLSTDAAVNQQINNELRSIVVQSRQAGVSPAKFVHDLAIAYGFKATAPDPTKVTMPDKLAAIAGAQEAAKTVGQVAGRAGGDALTPEAIAAMPPAEFERWANDPKNARLLDKMLGG